MKNNLIVDKLEGVKSRFDEVGRMISDPNAMSDMKRYVKLNKEYKELQPIIEAYKEYRNILDNIDSTKDMLNKEKDDELREMAKSELEDLNNRLEPLESKIKILLLPADPQDNKNAVLEIRAGTGGDEASIFAGDLHRMYNKYCEQKGWKVEIYDFAEGTVGGFKEIILHIKGEGVYGILKYESGVHRVQRVPQTETQGRVHTSAASVAILPEADEVDIQVKQVAHILIKVHGDIKV